MSSPSSESAVEKSRLPAATVGQLRNVGVIVTSEMLNAAWQGAEAARANWLAEATYFGLLCLAKQASMPKGKFYSWLAKEVFNQDKIGVETHPNRTQCVRLEDIESVTRNARRYLHLARSYLEIITQGRKCQHRVADTAMELWDPDAGHIEHVVGLRVALTTALEPAAKDTTLKHLNAWIAGRSLRQMLQDLKRSDINAHAEEKAEAAADTAAKEAPPAVPAPRDDAALRCRLALHFEKFAKQHNAEVSRVRGLANESHNETPAFWANRTLAFALLRSHAAAYQAALEAIEQRLASPDAYEDEDPMDLFRPSA